MKYAHIRIVGNRCESKLRCTAPTSKMTKSQLNVWTSCTRNSQGYKQTSTAEDPEGSKHAFCPAGKHHQNCSGASKGSCEACPAGQYKQINGVDQCTDCEPGRYHGDLGATECKLCEAGRFETGVGSTDCKACDYGCAKGEEKKVCGLAEPGTCTQCNLGYSKSVFSTDTCSACVAGKVRYSKSELNAANWASYTIQSSRSWGVNIAPSTGHTSLPAWNSEVTG